MFVLMGPMGGLGWDNTQTFFRNNWTHFQQILYRNNPYYITAPNDYGSGKPPWPTFRCVTCSRILPIDIAHADHIRPQANLQYRIVPQNPLVTVDPFNNNGTSTYTVASFGSLNVIITNGNGDIQYRYYEVEASQRRIVVAQRTLATTPPPVAPIVYGTAIQLYPGATKTGNPRRFEIMDILKNDLHNLQLLCPYCNVSKGNTEDNAVAGPATKKRKT